MLSVSQQTRDYLQTQPFLQEALRRGIINYAALARELIDVWKKEGGPSYKESTVMMALRRYQETADPEPLEVTRYGEQARANVETHLSLLTYQASLSVVEKFATIMKGIDYRAGDLMHVVHGSHQIAFVTNTPNTAFVKNTLKNDVLIRQDDRLVSVTLKYADHLIDIPGTIYLFTRALFWHSITIVTQVETMSESIFILKEKDASAGLRVLTGVLEAHR